jgi:hypothetical protein
MTWAGYPQNVSVARGPRSIFAGLLALPAKISASKIIGILRAARDKNSIMADSHLIRPITDDEYDGFRLVLQHAFHGGQSQDSPQWRRQLFEIGRSLAAFDPARPDAGPVASSGIYSFGMAVPGGVLPRRRRHDGGRAADPPQARHLAVDHAAAAHRHRRPRRGADRGAVGIGDAHLRPVRLR